MNGDTLEIRAEIDPGSAAEFGLAVRKGPSEETVIGISWAKSVLFVDRTRSGNVSFDPKFPGRQEAPLNLASRKTVALHIFVDRCSVEVFANDGEVVISDLVFPPSSSRGIELYSKGGKTRIENLDVWNLMSVWSK